MSKPIVLGAEMTPPFKLTPKGREVIDHPARIKVWKAGRRGSKTYTEAFFLAKNGILDRDPNGKHWYISPTLALGRDEIFPLVLALLPRDRIARIDDQRLTVKLTHGPIISCKSGEKDKNLRGRGLSSAVLDEASFLRPGIWDAIIRPQLAGSRGPAMIASSPKKGWFTQLFNRIVLEKLKDHAAFHSTIYDNPHMSREEIENIRLTTPINTWLQEYMAEEISEAGQVYCDFGGPHIYDPRERFQEVRNWACIRGLDWGMDDPTACIWVCISPEGYLVISGEHEQNDRDPAWHSDQIHSKSAGYTKLQANVLDRTAFRRESDRTSVADQFRDAGISCVESERDVASSIAIVQRFMRGDGQTPWLYVSARCTKLITALQGWEHGDHEPDGAAAMRYAVTHAVVRRLTKLADHAPILRSAARPVSEAEAKYLLAAEARVVPTKMAQGFSWNHDAGVPF